MHDIFTRLTKSPFAIFTVLGFVISLTIFQLLMNWVAFFAAVFGKPDLGYHDLPSIVHYAQLLLRWAVLIILGVIVAMDLRRRSFVRTGGYLTGVILALVVSFVILWVQWTAVMAD